MTYHYLVETAEGSRYLRLYDGVNAADAMAAWSKAITETAEYVTLEALRMVGT
jgi:hypothetical protein